MVDHVKTHFQSQHHPLVCSNILTFIVFFIVLCVDGP